MTWTNEFWLAVVVVLSILFLDLTGARADTCSMTGDRVALFANSFNSFFGFTKVRTHSANCISVQRWQARSNDGRWPRDRSEIEVLGPSIACKQGDHFVQNGYKYQLKCFFGHPAILYTTLPSGQSGGMEISFGWATLRGLSDLIH